jgi:hypothetical protein
MYVVRMPGPTPGDGPLAHGVDVSGVAYAVVTAPPAGTM